MGASLWRGGKPRGIHYSNGFDPTSNLDPIRPELHKSYKAGNEDDGATFFVGVIAVVAGVVGVMLATNGGYDAMSPALVLLGR